MRFLAKLIITALAASVAAVLIPGIELSSGWTAFILAAVLAFLNGVVKPVLVLLTIPFTILTFGFFLLVINTAMVLLADKLIAEFNTDGFLSAFLFSLTLSVINWILEGMMGKEDNKDDDH